MLGTERLSILILLKFWHSHILCHESSANLLTPPPILRALSAKTPYFFASLPKHLLLFLFLIVSKGPFFVLRDLHFLKFFTQWSKIARIEKNVHNLDVKHNLYLNDPHFYSFVTKSPSSEMLETHVCHTKIWMPLVWNPCILKILAIKPCNAFLFSAYFAFSRLISILSLTHTNTFNWFIDFSLEYKRGWGNAYEYIGLLCWLASLSMQG